MMTKPEIQKKLRANKHVSGIFARDYQGHDNKCCIRLLYCIYLLYCICFTFPALIPGAQTQEQVIWGWLSSR
jgi:hypothetical protein